jgi:hypothetical protein
MPTCANRWIHMALYIGRLGTPHIHQLADFLPSINELNQKHKCKELNQKHKYKNRCYHEP